MADDTNRYYYEPSQGHGLPHDPLNAIVGPRPIGWVATRGSSGAVNLAPYSTEIVQLKDHRQVPAQAWLVLGEVVAVHIANVLLKNGIFDTFGAGIVLRAGGPSGYAEITPDSRFDMIRPP